MTDSISDTIITRASDFNFWANFWSTFIAALFAFIFSLVLFFITKIIENRRLKTNLRIKVIRELRLNDYYLTRLAELCQKLIEISYDSDFHEQICKHEKIVDPINQSYRHYFTDLYHAKGYFYECLDNMRILELEKILNIMKIDQEHIIFSELNAIPGYHMELNPVQQFRDFLLERKKVYEELRGYFKGILIQIIR